MSFFSCLNDIIANNCGNILDIEAESLSLSEQNNAFPAFISVTKVLY